LIGRLPKYTILGSELTRIGFVLSDERYDRLASLSYSHAVRQQPNRSPNSPRPAGRRLNSKGPRPAGRGPPVGLKVRSKKQVSKSKSKDARADFPYICVHYPTIAAYSKRLNEVRQVFCVVIIGTRRVHCIFRRTNFGCRKRTLADVQAKPLAFPTNATLCGEAHRQNNLWFVLVELTE